jgi:cyclic pyranopterin phosphate synthase
VKDGFGRTIDYLRISVTDRCNLRCVYCMPPEGVELLTHDAILRLEEIVDVARVAVDLGVRKIRLTGGEPLVRRGIADLVSLLAAIPGLCDLSMTTNGLLLAASAERLAVAGLQRVNVSLDAMAPERYRHITRGGDVAQVLAGIAAARRAGLTPIKINCVVRRSPNERDASEVGRFAAAEGLAVRYIHQMDLAAGQFSVVDGGHGGDCPRCNRLRLSSDGLVRPCLFSDLGFSVRELGAAAALRRAAAHKPWAGTCCTRRQMYAIGG